MILYILVIFNTIISLMHVFALVKTYKIRKKLNTQLKIDTDFWEGLDINDILTDR